MKTLSIILISLLTSMVSRADGTALVREALFATGQIRQKPGTERMLTEYLSGIDTDCDTLYAMLYEPGFCPRCEVANKAHYSLLKKLSPNSRYLLITAYADSARAAAYNREKGNKADYYLYDTTEKYKDIFSFNTNGLGGQYVLKLCKSTGELLVGTTTLYSTPEFVSGMLKWSERIPTYDYAINDKGQNADDWQVKAPGCAPLDGAYTDRVLDTRGQLLSNVNDVPKYDGRLFYFNDNLNYCIMLFREEAGSLRFCSRITADSTEKMAFIEVPYEVYKQFDESELYYMPLSAAMTDSTHMSVSYSLPHILEDTISKTPGAYAFFNAACLIGRDLRTMTPQPIFRPDFMVLRDSFFYSHFNFCVFKGDIIYACQKLTFPMMYERHEYEHRPAFNPFKPEFYRSGNPWLAAFSLETGKLKKRFAELEPCAEAGRTGYWFINKVAQTDGRELLYTDGFSGTIHITDDIYHGTPQTYSAFAVDTAAFPPIDTAMFYKREYVKAYNRFYYRCITDARFTPDSIYCLVMYSRRDRAHPSPATNDYTVVAIDRHTGMATERLIPRYYGMTPMGYGFHADGARVRPFGFYRRTDGSYVVREWL